MGKYDRQIILKEVGENGQNRLHTASILCIGAGGLGCPALTYLVRAGIGRIGIVDHDTVQDSNLPRQTLYSTSDIGKAKVSAAKKALYDINPDCDIAVFEQKFDAECAENIVPDYDIVIDATDNFSTKYLINDACVKFSKPFIHGAIHQYQGYVSIFGTNDGPCYRCLYPKEPEIPLQNCADAGILSPVAGIMGTTQALQAIYMVLDNPDLAPIIGKLWTLNARTMESRLLDLDRNKECPVCSQQNTCIKLKGIEHDMSESPEIDITELNENDNILFVDVREQDEWDSGHIDGAIHVPLSELTEGNIPDLPTDKNIILYCAAGVRSMKALKILEQHNHKNLKSLRGGIRAVQNG